MNQKNRKNKVSIVIPVYNSEKTIGSIVDELIGELRPKYILEIILVNDASKDASENVCIDLHKKYSELVRFYSLVKNTGEHNAVIAGLCKSVGDYIIIMDDDFQNPPGEVNGLVKTAIEHDYDVVYTYSDQTGRSLFRKSGSMFANFTAGIVLKKPSGLYLSSFKCINRSTVNKIVEYSLPFTYIDGLILRTTDNIGKIKVEEHKRKIGRSGYSISKLSSLWLNIFFGFTTLRLKAALLAVILFLSAGFIFCFFLLLKTVDYSGFDMAWFLIVMTVFMITALHFILLWILGEYLRRKHTVHNKSPQYIIGRSYDSDNTKREKRKP